MSYWLHPDAASEHEEQVSYYEAQAPGLGRRYHTAFTTTAQRICEAPQRFRQVTEAGTRKAPIQDFPHNVIFRQLEGSIQILAIAHHRKRPGYWLSRL